MTLVPTRPRNGTSGGPVPPVGHVRPQPVDARPFVVHGVPTRMSIDEIFRHVDKLRLGVGERVVRARWLVELDMRRGKTAVSLLLYFNGVVPIYGKVLRFGGRWCPVDRYDFTRRSVPPVCVWRGLWQCCMYLLSLLAFPLDLGLWRLPAMVLGRMRGYMTLKKKKKKSN